MTKEQPKAIAQPTPGGHAHAIDEILAPVLNESGARQRLEAAQKQDKRTVSEVTKKYVELDVLIDAVIARLHAPEIPSEEAPPLPTDVLDPQAATPDAAIGVEAAPPEIPIDGVAEVTPTRPVPPLPQVESTADLPLIAPTKANTAAVNLLYEDIIWLVSIDDWGGALISLERLLVMAKLDGHVKEFVDVNEVKLLNLYESYLGPFSKKPTLTSRTLDNAMPSAYMRTEKLARLMELIDGTLDMSALFKKSPYSPLETCSAINQLRRSGLLEV